MINWSSSELQTPLTRVVTSSVLDYPAFPSSHPEESVSVAGNVFLMWSWVLWTTTISSKPALKFFLRIVTEGSYAFIFPPSNTFFFMVLLEIFHYEAPYRWVNTGLFYHAHSPAYGMLQRNILTYLQKNSDTFAGSMKLFQHLYSCPFFLHADSPEDETITPLYCAAFIVDCFMSVRFHFLLNLSSFTQGHTLLCICILQLFKNRSTAFIRTSDMTQNVIGILSFIRDWCRF